MDKDKIKEGVRLILEGIGEDPAREGLIDTPDRIARMYEEIFAGIDADRTDIDTSDSDAEAKIVLSKTFSADTDEIVLEKDITFYSMCEHHLLPFYGKAHIAYIPDGRVAGLSKLARTVEAYAKRPQLQERLTSQIADAIMNYLNARGSMVIIEAEHMCMTMRGIKKPGSKTMTYACRGEFAENDVLADRVLRMIK